MPSDEVYGKGRIPRRKLSRKPRASLPRPVPAPAPSGGGGFLQRVGNATGIVPLFNALTPGRSPTVQRRTLAPYGQAAAGISEMAGTNSLLRIANGRGTQDDYRTAAMLLGGVALGGEVRLLRNMPLGQHNLWTGATGMAMFTLRDAAEARRRYQRMRQRQK